MLRMTSITMMLSVMLMTHCVQYSQASLLPHPRRPPLPPLSHRQQGAVQEHRVAGTAAAFSNASRRADSEILCLDAFGKRCELCCGPALDGQCCEVVAQSPLFPSDVATITFTVRFTLIVDDTNSRNWSLESDDVRGQLRVLNDEFEASGSRFRFQLPTSFNTSNRNESHSASIPAAPVQVIRSTLLSRSCVTDSCYDNPTSCPFYALVLPAVNSTPHLDINVIVCDIHYDGESQFPWATRDETSNMQYIQIRYNAFFNKGSGSPRDGGKTLVHEMGHYFGLLHTFDGDCAGSGDFVADTPPAARAANPKNGCDVVDGPEVCSSIQKQQQLRPDTSNFMDYAADHCMIRFTPGQLRRMEQATIKYRPYLVNNATGTIMTLAKDDEGHSATNSSTTAFAIWDREWWSSTSGSNVRALVLIAIYFLMGVVASVLVTRTARRRYRPMPSHALGGEGGDNVANEERSGDDAHDELEDDDGAHRPSFPWAPKWLRRHYRRRPRRT